MPPTRSDHRVNDPSEVTDKTPRLLSESTLPAPDVPADHTWLLMSSERTKLPLGVMLSTGFVAMGSEMVVVVACVVVVTWCTVVVVCAVVVVAWVVVVTWEVVVVACVVVVTWCTVVVVCAVVVVACVVVVVAVLVLQTNVPVLVVI